MNIQYNIPGSLIGKKDSQISHRSILLLYIFNNLIKKFDLIAKTSVDNGILIINLYIQPYFSENLSKLICFFT